MWFSDLLVFDAYKVKWYIRRTSDFISSDALITVEIMPYCGQKVKMQIPLRPCWFLCERFYEQPCKEEAWLCASRCDTNINPRFHNSQLILRHYFISNYAIYFKNRRKIMKSLDVFEIKVHDNHNIHLYFFASYNMMSYILFQCILISLLLVSGENNECYI